MPTVVPVKFAYAARELWFDPKDSGAIETDHVICNTVRGREIGIVCGAPREVSHRELRATAGDGPLKSIERVANEADLERAEELAERGEQAWPTFRRLVSESGLDIKPVGVEWLFGGERVVCYFSADERVDFRQLVRELSRELHARVDMRQIGVREEAAVIGGYAHCGQELCCARFGRQFEPVSIRMAKEQDLPLNSTKISGACGRLMCCLRYEFEAYRDFKGRAPKRNAVINTPLGTAKIIEYDTPKEQLALRLENGKQVRVALSDMVASDAARKKADDLGCACRPDTVPREALERLQSPEVQMALAELDRKAGIVPEGDTAQGGDIFVSTRSRRRRGGGATGGGQARDEGTPADAKAKPARRRRRKKRGEGGGVSETPASQAAQAAQPSRATEGAEQGQAPRQRRRRRRHVPGEAGGGAEGAPANGTQADAGTPKKQAARPRRRPGDRGGQQATSAAGAAGGQQAQAGKTASGAHGQHAAEGAPRRRRRRHRGGGGGGAGKATEA